LIFPLSFFGDEGGDWIIVGCLIEGGDDIFADFFLFLLFLDHFLRLFELGI
jgi:hypothetical protein